MAKLVQTEHQIQCGFADWVSLMRLKDERFWNVFAIPNGGLRHIRVAQKLKREGVLAGVLDYALMVPRHPTVDAPKGHHGAFIEFKAGKNKMTKEQLEFADRMKKQGYYCALCYSTESAIDFTSWYMGLKNG
jgi:hypothetical protein